MSKPKHREEVAAGGVVFRHHEGAVQVCLVNTHDGTDWQFPKGHQDPGETLEETALREVLEETGLQAEILKCLHRSNYEFTKSSGLIVDKIVHWYLMAYRSGDLQFDGKEIHDACWLSPEQALTRLSYENERELCRQCMTDFVSE